MFDMIAFKCCWTKQKLKECENNFIRNGSLLQEEIIAVCKGKNLPIHVFSANEVTKMSTFTSDYIPDAHYRIFCGTIDEGNRRVFIKKFHSVNSFVGVEGILREIVTATQMCMHQNSLKLIGCCLETELPVIVYEFPDQGCLQDIISNTNTGFFPWKLRLKIGSEISYALAYLQNGFCRPVIFRNLSIKDVYLDKDYVTKLTGYYFSVLIPEGEVHVNDAVVGTTGSNAPEYIMSGRLTEKTDVYCLGVLLFELLVGRNRLTYWYQFDISRRIREHDQNLKISMFVDPEISCEIEDSGKQQQLQEVFELAWRCTHRNEDDRPSMIEVASELKKIADSN
uniref:Protein kinase domain-containing protein n=1 Tax=Chenopodium quinoa TaxID=63459 RepID=A0A803LW58_CHEQI